MTHVLVCGEVIAMYTSLHQWIVVQMSYTDLMATCSVMDVILSVCVCVICQTGSYCLVNALFARIAIKASPCLLLLVQKFSY